MQDSQAGGRRRQVRKRIPVTSWPYESASHGNYGRCRCIATLPALLNGAYSGLDVLGLQRWRGFVASASNNFIEEARTAHGVRGAVGVAWAALVFFAAAAATAIVGAVVGAVIFLVVVSLFVTLLDLL